MKKLFIASIACYLLQTSIVVAADFDISIDNGVVTRYNLQSLSVSSTGAVTAKVTSVGGGQVNPAYRLSLAQSTGGTISVNTPAPYTCTNGVCPSVVVTATPANDYVFSKWGGACASQTASSCVIEMNSDRAVSATFTNTRVPPHSGTCNPPGTTLMDVATELPAKVFPRADYRPTPTTIYSFAFRTKPAGEISTGQLSVAKLSSSLGGKLIVVSECRGDIDTTLTPEKTGGCFRFGAETSMVSYVVNAASPIRPTVYCNLRPNTQYYLNVVSRETSGGVPNCTNVNNCGFSFLAN